MNNSPDDLLSFKEFPLPPVHGLNSSTSNQTTAQITINSPEKTQIETRGDPLLDLINDMSRSVRVLSDEESKFSNGQENLQPEQENEQKIAFSPLSIEFYQRFFNVDTFMVVERIFTSMIPKRASQNYLKTNIGLNPDLYGPFWITVTLIFSIAISGNIASYLQTANNEIHWHYNFHLVSYAATAIFTYACFVPAAIWAVFKWSLKPNDDNLESDSAEYTPSLLSLMCIYGYSLAIYVPVSILWLIQYSLLQWILVLTAAILSGSVLILIMTPALRNSKYSLFLICGIISAHFLLAAGFMLYFFHVPNQLDLNVAAAITATEAPLKAVPLISSNQNNTHA